MKRVHKENLQSQVRNTLLESIQAGAFTDGRLPSEPKLAEMFGVSRATVSLALAALQREGLVVRKQGIGTYVNLGSGAAKVSINEATGYFDLIRASGHVPSIAWTKLEHDVRAPGPAERLGQTEDTDLVVVRRVICADGAPAVYVEEYLAATLPDRHLTADTFPESLFRFCKEAYGREIEFTVAEIIPCLAEGEVVDAFGCEPGEPVILMEETHLDFHSQPIAFSKVYSRDRFIRLRVTRVKGAS